MASGSAETCPLRVAGSRKVALLIRLSTPRWQDCGRKAVDSISSGWSAPGQDLPVVSQDKRRRPARSPTVSHCRDRMSRTWASVATPSSTSRGLPASRATKLACNPTPSCFSPALRTSITSARAASKRSRLRMLQHSTSSTR